MNSAIFEMTRLVLNSGADGKMAYIDPGSGSLIIQIILASALGFLFIIRNKIGQFFKWISAKLFKQGDDNE
jgi:hypothetical protein